MLLERAAAFFQEQGWQVKVNPCIIGDSGAIHTPDLQLVREGEKGRVVFVLEELDGPMPLEGRATMARDMGFEPHFVIGTPSPEVRAWCERHRRALVTDDELPGAAPPLPAPVRLAPVPAPAPPAVEAEHTGAELLTSRPRIPERPLTAFAAPAAHPGVEAPPARRLGRGVVEFPTEVPDDGDAVLLPSKPRADAPPPRRARPPPGPAVEDGGAVLLAAPALAVAPPEPLPAAAPEDSGAEMLPSRPTAPQDADKVMKHDPSIWDPRSRLAAVKQAAKAQGFEATGVSGPSSAWLRGIRKG